MNKSELLELKQQIEDTATEITKLETREELLMEQLKKDHNCATTAIAATRIKTMESAIEKLDDEIAEATEQLEKQLDESGTGPEE